jgi:phosphonate degradation associated HDIG domain protein
VNPIVQQIEELFTTSGQAAYFGEAVSQLEHALQAAHLAETARASDSLVMAALLHDLGHLLHELPEDVAESGIDGRHEHAGAIWLARWFRPGVTQPIFLHVAAKRYLCAVDAHYLGRLSPASVQSLQLQGGPFTPEEVVAFEQQPYCREAVQLRRWDDEAKVPGWEVPGLAHYLPRLQREAELRDTEA